MRRMSSDPWRQVAMPPQLSPCRPSTECRLKRTSPSTTPRRDNVSPKKAAQASVRRTTGSASQLLTAEERAAMRETINERRRTRSGEADGESEVLAKIAEMPEPDRVMAERLHAIIKAGAPTLSPRTWYGMPAYAKDGKVVCFFQGAQKFKSRYATFGFQQAANLDEGDMWPTSFALKRLTAADEARISALVKKAVS